MCEASGKPMNVNPIVRLPFLRRRLGPRDGVRRRRARRAGYRVHPQSSLQQMQVFFALHDTFLFDEMEAFREVLTSGDRARDAPRRSRGASAPPRALADTDGRAFVFTWDAVKVARADAHPEWVGRTVADLRARMEQRSPRRVPRRVAGRAPHHDLHARRLARRQVTRDDRARWSAIPPACPGAATPARTSPATAGSTSRRACSPSTCPDVISLEDAVRRLATIPAQMYGFADRGTVRAGSAGRPRGLGPESARGRPRPDGPTTSPPAAVASSWNPRDTARWSSTDRCSSTTASTPARVPARCSDRPRSDGSRGGQDGTRRADVAHRRP